MLPLAEAYCDGVGAAVSVAASGVGVAHSLGAPEPLGDTEAESESEVVADSGALAVAGALPDIDVVRDGAASLADVLALRQTDGVPLAALDALRVAAVAEPLIDGSSVALPPVAVAETARGDALALPLALGVAPDPLGDRECVGDVDAPPLKHADKVGVRDSVSVAAPERDATSVASPDALTADALALAVAARDSDAASVALGALADALGDGEGPRVVEGEIEADADADDDARGEDEPDGDCVAGIEGETSAVAVAGMTVEERDASGDDDTDRVTASERDPCALAELLGRRGVGERVPARDIEPEADADAARETRADGEGQELAEGERVAGAEADGQPDGENVCVSDSVAEDSPVADSVTVSVSVAV